MRVCVYVCACKSVCVFKCVCVWGKKCYKQQLGCGAQTPYRTLPATLTALGKPHKLRWWWSLHMHTQTQNSAKKRRKKRTRLLGPVCTQRAAASRHWKLSESSGPHIAKLGIPPLLPLPPLTRCCCCSAPLLLLFCCCWLSTPLLLLFCCCWLSTPLLLLFCCR